MDVIIDTCILLRSPSMRSADFESLFDYLRKMGSELIIPRIVFDEALARFPEKLSERYDKARAALGSLNTTCVSPLTPPVPDLDIAKETERYRSFLSSGFREGSALPVRVLSDYSGIDVREVAERGILRKAPSDVNGEQLRDVMVWLVSKSHCEASKAPTVFISCDKAFLNKEQARIKDDLAQELASELIELHVYPSIKDFLKSVATKTIALSKEWTARYINIAQLEEIFKQNAPRIASGVWHGERTVTVLGFEIEVPTGKLYDVGPGAQLAEVEVTGQLTLRISDWPYPPPEASLPAEEAREVRRRQSPRISQDHQLQVRLFVWLRLQDDKVVDVTPERFEYEIPPGAGNIHPSPLVLR